MLLCGAVFSDVTVLVTFSEDMQARCPALEVDRLLRGYPTSERLAEAVIELSVGSKGESYDNALGEMINGL